MTKTKSGEVVQNKIEINRRIQTEYLMNNILDKDFQAMLFPLSFVQSCFLMPRFSIINNFITPDNHVSFYIQSIIGCIILTLSHVFRFIYYSEVNKSFSTGVVVAVIPYFDLIFFSLISIVTYIVNSFQRSYVVDLIIKLQHVLDFIKIDKQKFLRKHKIQNWLSVLLVIIIYILQWFFACISYGIRKTCKNVLRLNRASSRKMSAFGMFELDATFPLRLLSIIVTYVVVLLQFAFLT
ncbi:uncharacterized protein LOC134800683 [Cydia splendana]|uniref:uncharacterized protein LOC134800683 n=1 Tax=Cydia splendana TaxID=1100963 RepID=UPI00300D1CF5